MALAFSVALLPSRDSSQNIQQSIFNILPWRGCSFKPVDEMSSYYMCAQADLTLCHVFMSAATSTIATIVVLWGSDTWLEPSTPGRRQQWQPRQFGFAEVPGHGQPNATARRFGWIKGFTLQQLSESAVTSSYVTWTRNISPQKGMDGTDASRRPGIVAATAKQEATSRMAGADVCRFCPPPYPPGATPSRLYSPAWHPPRTNSFRNVELNPVWALESPPSCNISTTTIRILFLSCSCGRVRPLLGLYSIRYSISLVQGMNIVVQIRQIYWYVREMFPKDLR